MALDAGWAGVIGAAIGVIGAVTGGFVTHWLRNRRAASLAEKRRARLNTVLNGNTYIWRSMNVLAASIGADESKTAELLIEIDARASLTNNQSWALVSRAPWPADMQPDS